MVTDKLPVKSENFIPARAVFDFLPLGDPVIALILAAGYGTRLRPHSETRPKSLMEIEPGVTILEYQLKQLREAGLSSIYVATRPELARLFSKYVDPSHILPVRVSEGDGNLVTLVKAWKQLEKRGVRGDLVVVMSDHIFERSIVTRLLQARDGRLLLCLDRRPRGSVVKEGLKVAIDGNGMIKVSKQAAPIQGVDTGLFLIPRQLLRLAEKLVRTGRGTLADLVNEASDHEKVGCVDVTGLLWLDVDSSKDLHRARRVYPKILARNLVEEGDGLVSRYINRRFSTPLSIFFYQRRVNVNPNLITVLVACLGILACISLFWNPIAGACLILLTSILDGVDGEVARLFGTTSRFGAVLDSLCDRVVDTLLLSVACIWVYQSGLLPAQHLLLLATFTIMGAAMVSYLSNWLGWSESLCRLRNSFPPATRDVRLLVLALGFCFEHPEMSLIYILMSSWIFVGRVVWGLRERVPKKVLPKRRAFPEITPHPRVELEGMIINTLSLILTIYLLQKALSLTSQLGGGWVLVGRTVAVVGVAFVLLFSLRLLKNIVGLFTGLKEHVVRTFWVGPGLYEKLGYELAAFISLLIIRSLVGPLAGIFGLSRWGVEVLDFALLALLCLSGVKLVLDFIRTFEHKLAR